MKQSPKKMAANIDSASLPRDLKGVPLQPCDAPGYYPGFSTFSQSAFWDDATRQVVAHRVDSIPSRQFFSAEEWDFWTVVFAHLIPQTDRTPDHQIPLVAPLDHRLFINQTVGYRFENMPQDREAYRMGLEAIYKEAEQRYVLKAFHDGQPEAAADIWHIMSVHRFWQLIMGDAIDAYYAHPWAWDEIGFGGPAYPRAYTRLERGEPEPWEVDEERYDWLAPEGTVSDEVRSAAHHHTEADQHKS